MEEIYTLNIMDCELYENVARKLKTWEVEFKQKNETTFQFLDFIGFDTAWQLMIRYEEEYGNFIFKKETQIT